MNDPLRELKKFLDLLTCSRDNLFGCGFVNSCEGQTPKLRTLRVSILKWHFTLKTICDKITIYTIVKEDFRTKTHLCLCRSLLYRVRYCVDIDHAGIRQPVECVVRFYGFLSSLFVAENEVDPFVKMCGDVLRLCRGSVLAGKWMLNLARKLGLKFGGKMWWWHELTESCTMLDDEFFRCGGPGRKYDVRYGPLFWSFSEIHVISIT